MTAPFSGASSVLGTYLLINDGFFLISTEVNEAVD